MKTVTVRHNFETAHRLYGQGPGGKCWNLHGHSFWVEAEVGGEPNRDGMIVEYGALKKALRGWVDEHLDHGTVLNALDPLANALKEQDCKMLLLPGNDPTVEALAGVLGGQLYAILRNLPDALKGHDVHPVRVTVFETHVNAATWRP